MPVSAYLKSGLFVVAAAAALFATAGTIAIASFWIYLAILAVVIIVSLAALDPDLLRERMRPGGKKSPLSLRIFSLVLFVHWIVAGLDRGRFHWSDDGRGRLRPGTMGHARQPVFLLAASTSSRRDPTLSSAIPDTRPAF
jgi:hypothetical protein